MPTARRCTKSARRRIGGRRPRPVRRPPARALAVVGCLLAACRGEPAAEAPIQTDGQLDEWGSALRHEAPQERMGEAPVSVRAIRVADDPVALHLALELDRSINVQGLRGALLLALDADGDPASGSTAFGRSGVDVVLSFTRLLRDDGAPGAGLSIAQGVGAWRPDPTRPDEALTPSDELDGYALGLGFEPRHASDRIEIRLDKRSLAALGEAGSASAVGGTVVVVDSAGRVARVGPGFDHRLRARRALPSRAPGIPEPASPPGLRLVSWNVSRDNMLVRPEPFRRILAALAPDVVLLDEVPAAAREADVRVLLPDPRDGSWSTHLGTSGSRQRGAIAVRRGVLLGVAELARVALPDSVRAHLGRPASADLEEVRADLAGAGVPVAGAWLEVEGRLVLLATLDLVCCGNAADAPEDRIRRIQADAIHEALRRALASRPGVAAVVVGGDFNLVGSTAPLDIARRGLDPASGDLVSARALQLDGTTTATWTGFRGPFPPGRLDYVLFSPSALQADRAFVFETGDLSPEELAARALVATDSDRASDHRPIVVDFAWRGPPRPSRSAPREPS